MSVLCDLFIGTEDDALAYEAASPTDREALGQRLGVRSFGGFTSLEFETLWAILEGGDWDPDRHELIDLTVDGGEEAWLHEFQDEYLSLLAELNEDSVKRVAQAWSETEELSCSPDAVLPVLQALIALAKQARAVDSKLYLWGSL